jgi:hypothetical protein
MRITCYLVNFFKRNNNLSVVKQWLNKNKLHEKLKKRITSDVRNDTKYFIRSSTVQQEKLIFFEKCSSG